MAKKRHLKQLFYIVFASFLLFGFQNCKGKFEAQVEDPTNLSSQTPKELYCVPNKQIINDCSLEIANATSAERVKICKSDGSSFVFGNFCELKSCLPNFQIVDNRCESTIVAPEPICVEGTDDEIPCDANFATDATRTRSCDLGGLSYTTSNLCVIRECDTDHDLDSDNNLCVDKPTYVCEFPSSQMVSCLDQVDVSAAVAMQSKSCDEDRVGYSYGSCQISDCDPGFELSSGGSCVAKEPPTEPSGDAFYLAVNGSDFNPGTFDLPWKLFSFAFTQIGPGDTLRVKDGTYQQRIIAPARDNSINTHTNIVAINPGSVTIDAQGQGAALSVHSTHHFIFDGFRLINGSSSGGVLEINSPDGPTSVATLPTHNIIIRNISVEGSCNSHNCIAASISRSRDILVEDSWFFGASRYVFALYSAYNVTVRRSVVRWDYWDGSQYKVNDPRFAVSLYNNHNSTLENVIIIDSGSTNGSGDKGGMTLAGGDNGDSDLPNQKSSKNNKFFGMIVVNNVGVGIDLESRHEYHENNLFEHNVVYNNNGGLNFNKLVGDNLFNHISILNNNPSGVSSWADGIRVEVKNSIIANHTKGGGFNENGSFNDMKSSYNLFYNNESNDPKYTPSGWGAGSITNANPDLQYILDNDTTTLNASINLGDDGESRGAKIINRYKDGILTNIPLWPWPNEALIKSDLCSSATLTKYNRTGTNAAAWCESGKSLTKYLWEINGNACPTNICN
ncbi:MAG: hypothetical protein HOO06_14690 [Bdellovibrionaceae bacterium]|jgi:hypothetical protein|nr:hypothetical protein [Pseudobdellovibrionaceae bacterium]